jgi:polysaccharide deacetylase 2 family uncharacterized protein YibQ
LARFHRIFRVVARSTALPWSGVVLAVAVLGWIIVAGLDPDGVPLPVVVGPLTRIDVAAAPPPPPPHESALVPAAVVPETTDGPDRDEPAEETRAPQGSRVAILLTGMGLDPALVRAASELPKAVGFAWSVYADDPLEGQASVRRQGREVWLELPVSRGDPQRYDLGPLALSPARSDGQNLERLVAALERGQDLAGVVAEPGAFAPSPVRFEPVAGMLASHALPLLLHGEFARSMVEQASWSGTAANGSIGMTTRAELLDRFLDDLATRAEMDGAAIGVLRVHPLTVARTARWQERLAEWGLTLVPPSMLLHLPPTRAATANAGGKNGEDGGEGHGG